MYFINGISYLFDFNSRVNVNDSLLNSFNFFWTSFTYLPLFFFLALLFFVIFFNLYNPTTLLICLLLSFILFSFETLDFLIINYNAFLGNISNSNINLLLSNNLNKYHPFIFYISIFIVAILILLNYYFFLITSLFFNNFLLLKNYKITLYNFPINSLALFLGSWWALQEGTWGGWWNWDASEVFGLLVSLYSISRIHSAWFITHNQQSNTYLISSSVLIVLVYFFIQLNFDLVSHNFGSRFFYFFSNNLFFLESITLSVVFLIYSSYNTMLIKVSDLISLVIGKKYIHLFKLNLLVLLLIIIITTLIIVNSFLPLWNYFLWNYFLINNFNFNLSVNLLIILFLFIFIQYFLTNNLFILFIISLITVFKLPSCILLIPFTLILTSNRITTIHFIIILALVININSYTINFIQWSNLNTYTSLIQNDTILNFKQITLTCDSTFIDKSQFYTDTTLYSFNLWNTYFKSNSCTLSSFLLYYDFSTFFNHYLILNHWVSTILHIETNLLNNLLDIITSFLMFTVIKYFFSKLFLS